MAWTAATPRFARRSGARPIPIAADSRQSVFVAVLMISSLLNIAYLLPIPILDGGHLLYYLVELVKGSPVSETAQLVGQRVGIVILLMLMTLAFYNDLTRLFG